MAISAAEATQKAAIYYREISQEEAKISVEEIQKNESGDAWLITLGITSPMYTLTGSKNKEYKIFNVNIESGEVESMRIRKV